MIFNKNKKAAIEMSMTTIVTIVLVVVTLVLALVLIRTIFTSSTNAIDQVNAAIQDQINQLFASEGGNIVVYPSSKQITIIRGDTPKGIGFEIQNPEKVTANFAYNLTAIDVHDCGTTFTLDQANSYVLGGSGPITLGPGAKQTPYDIIEFKVPSSAIPCTVIYNLNVLETSPNSNSIPGGNIFVTIQ